MGDVVGLLDHWRDYPPEHLILRAVYLKPTASSQPRRGREDFLELPPSGENETMQGLAEFGRMAGAVMGAPQKMPAHLVAMADYAEEVTAKMKKTHAG